jgi:hypothetical protein
MAWSVGGVAGMREEVVPMQWSIMMDKPHFLKMAVRDQSLR